MRVDTITDENVSSMDLDKTCGDTTGIFLRQGDGFFDCTSGIFVSRLEMGSMAEHLGLRVGDELMKVNSIDVSRGNIEWVEMLMKAVNIVVLTVRKPAGRSSGRAASSHAPHNRGHASATTMQDRVASQLSGYKSNLTAQQHHRSSAKPQHHADTTQTPRAGIRRSDHDHDHDHDHDQAEAAATRNSWENESVASMASTTSSAPSEPDFSTIAATIVNTVVNSSSFPVALVSPMDPRNQPQGQRTRKARRSVQFNLPDDTPVPPPHLDHGGNDGVFLASNQPRQQPRHTWDETSFELNGRFHRYNAETTRAATHNQSPRHHRSNSDHTSDRHTGGCRDTPPRRAMSQDSDSTERPRSSSVNEKLARLLDQVRTLKQRSPTRSPTKSSPTRQGTDNSSNSSNSPTTLLARSPQRSSSLSGIISCPRSPANTPRRSSSLASEPYPPLSSSHFTTTHTNDSVDTPLEITNLGNSLDTPAETLEASAVVCSPCPVSNDVDYAVETVTLARVGGKGLGLNITGGTDSALGALFVAKIHPGSNAEEDGRVLEGCRILAVQGAETARMTQQDLVHFLKSITAPTVTLKIMNQSAEQWGTIQEHAAQKWLLCAVPDTHSASEERFSIDLSTERPVSIRDMDPALKPVRRFLNESVSTAPDSTYKNTDLDCEKQPVKTRAATAEPNRTRAHTDIHSGTASYAASPRRRVGAVALRPSPVPVLTPPAADQSSGPIETDLDVDPVGNMRDNVRLLHVIPWLYCVLRACLSCSRPPFCSRARVHSSIFIVSVGLHPLVCCLNRTLRIIILI